MFIEFHYASHKILNSYMCTIFWQLKETMDAFMF